MLETQKENDAITNDTRSSILSKVLDAPLPLTVPPLTGAFEAMRVSADRFCLVAGLAALQEMMAEDVALLCGPAHRRDPERQAYRWGTTVGELAYQGGKVRLRRPRVRDLASKEARRAGRRFVTLTCCALGAQPDAALGVLPPASDPADGAQGVCRKGHGRRNP